MAFLARCAACRGFLPIHSAACPNCGASEPAGDVSRRVGNWLKAAGGASVAMTLMACYGVPVDPYEPPDTDTTGSTGDTESATSTGAAESTTSAGSAESTTSAESSGGSESGSESGTGTTGAGGVDEPELPR